MINEMKPNIKCNFFKEHRSKELEYGIYDERTIEIVIKEKTEKTEKL